MGISHIAHALILTSVFEFCFGDTVWLVPVSNYTLIWKEWRNPACKLGSFWRPDLTPIDPGDGKARPVILPGDIFVQTQDPPPFVSTVLVQDRTLKSCPTSSSYPCFDADPSSQSPLFAAATFPAGDSVIWNSIASQCKCGEIPAGATSCTVSQAALDARNLGNTYLGQQLTGYETGYIQGQESVELKKPLCPAGYHTLGHLAVTPSHPVPQNNYYCISERILRRAGDPARNRDSMLAGAGAWTRVYKAGVPWFQDRNSNPTVLPEYQGDVTILSPDCGFQGCTGVLTDTSLCVNDTISQGLFYAFAPGPAAGAVEAAKVTPADPNFLRILSGLGASNPAPLSGPRCLVPYRACSGDCDYELGLDSTGSPVPAGVQFAVPSGAPVQCGDEDGCAAGKVAAIQVTFYVSKYFWSLLLAAGMEPAVSSTFPQVSLTTPNPAAFVAASTVADAPTPTGLATLTFNIPYAVIQASGGARPGPCAIRFQAFDGTVISTSLATGGLDAGYNAGLTLGRFYLYQSPSAASLSPSVGFNGPLCQTAVQVQMPSLTNLMSYGGVDCLYRDAAAADEAIAAAPAGTTQQALAAQAAAAAAGGFSAATRVSLLLGAYPRAVLCLVPPKTGTPVQLRITMNGQHFHLIAATFKRVTSGALVPGQGALRLYSLSPRSGPGAGGTQVTVFGRHFSFYKSNNILCRFTFQSPLGPTTRISPARYIDNRRLECFTPAVVGLASQAQVDVSVDGSAFCAAYSGAKVGDPAVLWNRLAFYYTQSVAVPSGPPAAPALADWRLCVDNVTLGAGGTVADDPTGFNYPPVASAPTSTPALQCRGMASTHDAVAGLGWFGCLKIGRTSTTAADVANPVWCMRAIPAHAGHYYALNMYDPELRVIGFLVRAVPLDFPGRCSRARSALDAPVLITFQVVVALRPASGLTPEQAWTQGGDGGVGGPAFQSLLADTLAAAAAASPSQASKGNLRAPSVATFVRVAVPGSGQVSVDVEVSARLADSEPMLAYLNGNNFWGKVISGKPTGAANRSSALFVGGNQVLTMTPPFARETERTFSPWRTQLDYRQPKAPNVTDPTDPAAAAAAAGNSSSNASAAAGSTALPGGATPTASAGRALIDALLSHPAAAASPPGADGRDVGYMRAALHQIGEQYGFLDLTTPAFGISWDLRMVSEYDETLDRASAACALTAAAASQFQKYSGLYGGDGFVDWEKVAWTEGQAMCSNANCAQPPFGKPARTTTVVNAADRAAGCVRLRLSFNCSAFDLGECMRGQVDPGKNPAAAYQYAHAGTRTPFLDPQGWCDFYYPEAVGPNKQGQADPPPDYRYRYRHSPCVQCRQARDICAALAAGGAGVSAATATGGGLGNANRRDDGILNYAVEYDVGCFARGHTGGLTWDSCCPDACSPSCASLDTATEAEICLRAAANPVCADPRHGPQHRHTACGSQCGGTPRTCAASGASAGPTPAMCSPRDAFFEPV